MSAQGEALEIRRIVRDLTPFIPLAEPEGHMLLTTLLVVAQRLERDADRAPASRANDE